MNYKSLSLIERIEMYNKDENAKNEGFIYSLYGSEEGSFYKAVNDKGMDFWEVIESFHGRDLHADYCLWYHDGMMELFTDWSIDSFLDEKGYTENGYFDPKERVILSTVKKA